MVAVAVRVQTLAEALAPKDGAEWGHFIGGRFVYPPQGGWIEDRDPSTGRVLALVADGTPEDVNGAVDAAGKGFREWSAKDGAERARVLLAAAELLVRHREPLGALEARDSGGSYAAGIDTVQNVAAERFRYYAGVAMTAEDRMVRGPGGNMGWLVGEPRGVTAHIVPWNGPLWEVTRSVAPALAAGCSVVVKPSREAMLSILALGPLLQAAGLPDGVFNVVVGSGAAVGEPLILHPAVAHVTFTGSVETGRRIGELAGHAIKPAILELGGKSANVVFADADWERAVPMAVVAGFANAGQICVAGSRLLVEASVADQFLERVAALTRGLRVGPAMENPDVGPLITEAHLRRVHGFVERAAVPPLTGGHPLPGDGYFYAPTVIEAPSASEIHQDEIFGPVLAVDRFESVEEAIRLANDTRYGLAAAVWTRDLDRAAYVARRLEAGTVYVNRYFHPGVRYPSGGIKASGYGQSEGLEAYRNYLQLKTVAIETHDPN